MGYAAVENHYGNNYVTRVDSEDDIDYIMTTCERCGDSDWLSAYTILKNKPDNTLMIHYLNWSVVES